MDFLLLLKFIICRASLIKVYLLIRKISKKVPGFTKINNTNFEMKVRNLTRFRCNIYAMNSVRLWALKNKTGQVKLTGCLDADERGGKSV